MGEVFVRKVALPGKIRGATVVDKNGDFIIFINENLSDMSCQSALVHELMHLRMSHFSSEHSVACNEKEAEANSASTGQ